MKILFVFASPEFLRFYDSTVQLLAERGHWVGVAVTEQKEGKPVRLEQWEGAGTVAPLGLVPPRVDRWTRVAPLVRGTMDWLRYVGPAYAEAPALRARAARKGLPPLLRFLDRVAGTRSAATIARAVRALAACERAIPTSTPLDAFLDAHRPDVVVVSPLVDTASDQVDVVRSARARGVPTVAAIASWDNLTNKGLLRVVPDMVTVWNEAQKQEALTLHGVPAERVAITGAQPFDKWFTRQPSRSREAFAARVGLASAQPFVLFTGSSMFISKPEAEVAFVGKWLTALRRSSDPELRNVPVLIRPHPYNGWIWADVAVSLYGDTAVWPKGRYNPVDEDNRDDYFDSLSYSRAVVGINTSAMVEAAILGRPVHSIVTDDFARTQEGTLHFKYLLPENGGFLRVATSLEEHVRLLAASLRNAEAAREETSRFVRWFVRPHGIDQPCTPILADAIERAARLEPLPAARGSLALRAALVPIAGLVPLLDGWKPIERRLAPIRKFPRSLRRSAVKQARRLWRQAF